MKKYRIKTKEEFLNEGGPEIPGEYPEWRQIKCGFVPGMDYLLGQALDNDKNLECEEQLKTGSEIIIVIDGYNVSEEMLIESHRSQTSSLNLRQLINDDVKITLQQNN